MLKDFAVKDFIRCQEKNDAGTQSQRPQQRNRFSFMKDYVVPTNDIGLLKRSSNVTIAERSNSNIDSCRLEIVRCHNDRP